MLILDFLLTDVNFQNRAKTEGGQDVYGLISFIESGKKRMSRISGSRRSHIRASEQDRNAQKQDKSDQQTSHHPAKDILGLSGMHHHQCGNGKEGKDADPHNKSLPDQPTPHFSSSRSSTGDGDAGADQHIDDGHEDGTERFPDPADRGKSILKQGDNRNYSNRHDNRRDQHSGQDFPGRKAGLCAEIRSKDQIPGTKKHRKQGDAKNDGKFFIFDGVKSSSNCW